MSLRLAWQVFSLEARNLLNYRVDFWVNWLVGTATQLAVAWFLWSAIFAVSGTSEIGGFSFKAMMLYYTLASVVDRAVQIGGRHVISNDIYEGSLNRYLVFPVDIFKYKTVESLAHTLFFVSQGLLLYMGFIFLVGLPEGVAVTALGLIMGLTSLFVAMIVFLAMLMIVEQIAFWADNVWSLIVMLSLTLRLLGGVMVPLTLFPAWAQDILNGLPFGYMVSLPIKTLMGQVPPAQWLQGMAMMAIWGLVFWLIALVVWKRGNLKYSGVGI